MKKNLNMNIVLYYAGTAVLTLLFCLNIILFMEDSKAYINMNLTAETRVIPLNLPMFLFFIGSEALIICGMYICKRWLGKDIDKLKNRKKK